MPSITEITGCTRKLAEDQPEYQTLPVRDELLNGWPVMTSAWTFTDEELAMLLKGGKLELSVMGSVHPPIMLTVVPPLKNPMVS